MEEVVEVVEEVAVAEVAVPAQGQGSSGVEMVFAQVNGRSSPAPMCSYTAHEPQVPVTDHRHRPARELGEEMLPCHIVLARVSGESPKVTFVVTGRVAPGRDGLAPSTVVRFRRSPLTPGPQAPSRRLRATLA